ncbi:MAG: hypothetical protein ABSB40_04225 [Nitrososphaeria archaeon]
MSSLLPSASTQPNEKIIVGNHTRDYYQGYIEKTSAVSQIGHELVEFEKPDPFIHDTSLSRAGKQHFTLIQEQDEIKFFFDPTPFPYLPPSTLKLRDKKELSERDFTYLMRSIAKHAIQHFKLQDGLFVAFNFKGQVIEVAPTKVDLLKKIQMIPQSLSIFIWKVGSDYFDGWY